MKEVSTAIKFFMVTTRTGTQSLPKKQATHAELHAIWSNIPKTSSTIKDTSAPKKQRKRRVAECESSASTEDMSSPKKAQKSNAVTGILEQALVPVIPMAVEIPQKSNSEAKTTFLSLPAEIRNEIYSLAIVEPVTLNIRSVHPYLLEPGLLGTNRQVRSEALGIWYSGNVFEIDGSSPAVKFLRATSDDKLRALRCFRIFTTFLPAADYIDTRINQLLREFQPRGLDKQAIHFMVSVTDGFEWVNLARLKRIKKMKKDGGS